MGKRRGVAEPRKAGAEDVAGRPVSANRHRLKQKTLPRDDAEKPILDSLVEINRDRGA